MEIEGYKYIAHKLIQRPWGPECRFTVARLPDNSHINEVIVIESIKIEESVLAEQIASRCKEIDSIVAEPVIDLRQVEIDAAVSAKEAEIKAMLVAKEMITAEQQIADVKTKADYANVSKEVES